MDPVQVVVGHELVEVALNLVDGEVEGFPSLYTEAFVERVRFMRSTKPLV